MKMNIITSLLLIFSSGNAVAVEVETLFTCEESEDKDNWFEVGIAMSDGPGFQLILVEHDNVVAGKPKQSLAASVPVQKVNSTTFANKSSTTTLTIKKGRRGQKIGKLAMKAAGAGSLYFEGMNCFSGGTIQFDAPRN